MSSNNEPDKDAKGFGGLSSLLSDVDDLPSSQPTPKNRPKEDSSRRQAKKKKKTQNNQSTDINNHQPDRTQPPLHNIPSSDQKWILIGLALFIGGFVLFSSQTHSSSKPKHTNIPSTLAGVDFSTPQPSPKKVVPARPVEEKPPYGKNKVLNAAQIRYCLAEKVRIDASEKVINNYSHSDVDRFNSMVNDYNNRCGAFRYRRGNLKHAQRDIDPYRSQIRAEGKARFVKVKPKPNEPVSAIKKRLNTSKKNGITADRLATNGLSNHLQQPVKKLSNSPAIQPKRIKPKPNETLRAIQKRLNKLGYNAGSVDGYMGKKTRTAIIRFQRDAKLNKTGIANKTLLAVLNKALPKLRAKSRPDKKNTQATGGDLNSFEKASITQVCESARKNQGSDNYYSCLKREIDRIGYF